MKAAPLRVRASHSLKNQPKAKGTGQKQSCASSPSLFRFQRHTVRQSDGEAPAILHDLDHVLPHTGICHVPHETLCLLQLRGVLQQLVHVRPAHRTLTLQTINQLARFRCRCFIPRPRWFRLSDSRLTVQRVDCLPLHLFALLFNFLLGWCPLFLRDGLLRGTVFLLVFLALVMTSETLRVFSERWIEPVAVFQSELR